jgi:hypothetical protein
MESIPSAFRNPANEATLVHIPISASSCADGSVVKNVIVAPLALQPHPILVLLILNPALPLRKPTLSNRPLIKSLLLVTPPPKMKALPLCFQASSKLCLINQYIMLPQLLPLQPLVLWAYLYQHPCMHDMLTFSSSQMN